MRTPIAILLALATAACTGAEPPAQNAMTNNVENATATAAESGAQIAALPDEQRNATFYRAIHDAGMDCQQVTESARGGTYQNMPVWNARCRGGGQWTIVIGSGGTAQVLNANEARLITDQTRAEGNTTGR